MKTYCYQSSEKSITNSLVWKLKVSRSTLSYEVYARTLTRGISFVKQKQDWSVMCCRRAFIPERCEARKYLREYQFCLLSLSLTHARDMSDGGRRVFVFASYITVAFYSLESIFFGITFFLSSRCEVELFKPLWCLCRRLRWKSFRSDFFISLQIKS